MAYGPFRPQHYRYAADDTYATVFRMGLDTLVDIAEDFKLTSVGKIAFYIDCFDGHAPNHPCWADKLQYVGRKTYLPRFVDAPTFRITARAEPIHALHYFHHNFSHGRPLALIEFVFPEFRAHTEEGGGIGKIKRHQSAIRPGYLGADIRLPGQKHYQFQHTSIQAVLLAMANVVAKTYGVKYWQNHGPSYANNTHGGFMGISSFPTWPQMQQQYNSHWQGVYAPAHMPSVDPSYAASFDRYKAYKGYDGSLHSIQQHLEPFVFNQFNSTVGSHMSDVGLSDFVGINGLPFMRQNVGTPTVVSSPASAYPPSMQAGHPGFVWGHHTGPYNGFAHLTPVH